MKNLILEIPEAKQLEINGHKFSICKSDIYIINKFNVYASGYEKLKNASNQQMIKYFNDAAAFIDEILGKGADYSPHH